MAKWYNSEQSRIEKLNKLGSLSVPITNTDYEQVLKAETIL